MNIEPKFLYTPIEVREDLTISEPEFLQYLRASGTQKILETLVIDPFNEALKSDGKPKYDFGFKITRTDMSKDSTSWQPIFEKFKTYLEIRADDSKAKEMSDLKYIEGLGYCINIDLIIEEIEKRKKENTSHSEYPQMNWPRKKKSEPNLRDIFIPDRNYSEINLENARICLNAKRFNSGLENEVINTYKGINQEWLFRETGFNAEKIPPKEVSPITRFREIVNNYVLIQLVREDKGNYPELMNIIIADLNKIKSGENGELSRLYNVSKQDDSIFINIKKIKDRLDSLFKFNTDVRYTIIP